MAAGEQKAVRFRDLLGQERAAAALRLAAAGGRLPHAYLFCGIEGSGRRTAARMLAASLNCERPEAGEACGNCLSCRKLARGTHPDLVSVEPEAEAARKAPEPAAGRRGRTIKIGQVRELCRRLSFAPAEARVRLCVLWPAGSLGEDASNALLKTLEEPPPGNLLILCCREPGDVLPTIASRCQALSFAPLADEVVRNWLLAAGAQAEQAELWAYLSGGSLSRAGRLLEPGLAEAREGLLGEVAVLSGSAPSSKVMALAEALAHSGHLDELLEALKSFFRDALVLAATGSAERAVNRDFLARLEDLAERAPAASLGLRLSLVERAQAAIEANCEPQLALEVMLFGLAGRQQGGIC